MSVFLDTENRGYPLPNQANYIDEDLQRIIDALNAIDVDMATVIAGLLNKAALSHGHLISDVSGLQAALDGKMAAGATVAFSSLTGVDIASAVQNMFLRYDGSKWIPVAFDAAMIASGTINTARLPAYLASSALSSAYSPLGHGHAISEIVGLQTSLDGKAASSHTHGIAQISGLGTAASKNTGTGANDIVQLDANARLPALDARNLTNLTIPSKATKTVYNSGAGNFTLPNAEWVFVRLWAGGGAGSSTSPTGQYSTQVGGGGGAYKEKLYRLTDLGSVGGVVAYSVGAGGAAVQDSSTGTTMTTGNPGGNSTFGSLTAYGGGGGGGSNVGMGGGYFSNGDNADSGYGGTNAAQRNASSPWGGASAGGNALYGGAGGGGKPYNSNATYAPGVSLFGGNGGANNPNGAGNPGSAPGGGGGGGAGNMPSGKGGDGRIEIYTW